MFTGVICLQASLAFEICLAADLRSKARLASGVL
jgi:hypothetical protein